VPAFLTWNVMMVAMMLPSLFPWLFLFSLERAVLFTAGYFTVWAAYCSAAAAVQTFFHVPMDGLPRVAGGVLLAGAGLYQLTPLKDACLRKCRSPVGALLGRWRSGSTWAFRTGVVHGATCVGCCWALMALAFVLGVMNVVWMAALTMVVLVEKLAPRGEDVSRWLGIGLIVWGLGVSVAAGSALPR
jgi:predicted metal-binding membrane protein